MILNKETFCKLAEQGRIKLYIPMGKLNIVFGITFKDSIDKKKRVECLVEPYRFFKISEGYKVTARAVNKEYGSESYYVSDLLQLIDCGYIKAKITM